MSRRIAESRLTPLFAALLSLSALVVGGLAWQTWRTARTHRNAVERVLADYASFAAWSYASRVRAATFFAINPVFAGADRAPPEIGPVLRGLRTAADSLEKCRCGIDLHPRFVFLIDLERDTTAVLMRDSSMAGATVRAQVENFRTIAAKSLARESAAAGQQSLPYRWVADQADGQGWIAFYSTRFRSPSDHGVIVGFLSRTESLVSSVLEPAHRESPLLPRSLVGTLPGDSILTVEVRLPLGATVYRSGNDFDQGIAATEPLGLPDTVLTARVTLNHAAAPRLIIGGVPSSPLLTILPLLSLAIALLAFAFVIARRRDTLELELRARLSEAKLAALRGQLQPHFLFNVLNSIAMLARQGDSRAVVSTLNQLGDLLRTVLREQHGEMIEVSEELGFIEKYLTLEKVRFQERLRFRIACPPELASSAVPAFILQPLVENAIKHGLGRVEAGGTLDIAVSASDGRLTVDVTDDGAGLGGPPPVEGIGLRNTRARLAQIYGDAASLELEEPESGGARARLRIPKTKAASLWDAAEVAPPRLELGLS